MEEIFSLGGKKKTEKKAGVFCNRKM